MSRSFFQKIVVVLLMGVFAGGYASAIGAEQNSSDKQSDTSLSQALEHILSNDYLKENHSTGFITIPDTDLQMVQTEPTVNNQPKVNAFYMNSYPEKTLKAPKNAKVRRVRKNNQYDAQSNQVASISPDAGQINPKITTKNVTNQNAKQTKEPEASPAPPISVAIMNGHAAQVQENQYLNNPRFYQTYQYIRRYNKKLLPGEAKLIAQAITDFSVKYHVDHRVVTSVIAVESAFKRNAISSSGAIGLGQLKPATARWLGVKDPYNPVDNVGGCTKYIAMLTKKYKGNLSKALSVYYQGPGTIDRHGINDAARYYVSKIQKALRRFEG